MIQKAMKQIGRIFGAPIVIEGKTWFPFMQLIVWEIMAWLASRRDKQRTPIKRMAVGAVTMPVVLGSEWGHNLAHAAVADLVGKPADGIMIIGGMPRSVNDFIGLVALLPIPFIDGGPILKWCLVRRGRNTLQADDIVRKVNGFMGCAMSTTSLFAAKRRRWLPAIVLALFAGTSLGVASGFIKEQSG